MFGDGNRLTEREIVDNFSRELDEIEKLTPMRGSYTRLDPVVREHVQAGQSFKFIVFHQESRDWYPVGTTEWSLFHMNNHEGFVRPDDVIFDLGCNAGFLTMWFALKAPHGHVHAFDPYPWNAAATRAQARLNGLSNVTVHAVGIGPERKTLSVPLASSSTFNTKPLTGHPSVDLQIEPLEAFKHAKPTFMKIDIEGAEHELGQAIICSGVQRGYVEMHPQFIAHAGGWPEKVIEELYSANFEICAHGPGMHPWLHGSKVEAIGYYFQRTVPSPRKRWPF